MSETSTTNQIHTINLTFNLITINRGHSTSSLRDANYMRQPSRWRHIKRHVINKIKNLTRLHGAGIPPHDPKKEETETATNQNNEQILHHESQAGCQTQTATISFQHSQRSPENLDLDSRSTTDLVHTLFISNVRSNSRSFSPILPVPQQQVEHWSQASESDSSRTHSFLRSSTLATPSLTSHDNQDSQDSGTRSSQGNSGVPPSNNSRSVPDDSSHSPCFRSGMTCLSCSCQSCHPSTSEKEHERQIHPRLLSFHDLKKLQSSHKMSSSRAAGSDETVKKDDDSAHVSHHLNEELKSPYGSNHQA